MMSEIRVFMICVLFGFVGSFGGAHLLADLFDPAAHPVLDGTLLLLAVVGRLLG